MRGLFGRCSSWRVRFYDTPTRSRSSEHPIPVLVHCSQEGSANIVDCKTAQRHWFVQRIPSTGQGLEWKTNRFVQFATRYESRRLRSWQKGKRRTYPYLHKLVPHIFFGTRRKYLIRINAIFPFFRTLWRTVVRKRRKKSRLCGPPQRNSLDQYFLCTWKDHQYLYLHMY